MFRWSFLFCLGIASVAPIHDLRSEAPQGFPSIEVVEVKTISWKPPLYHGWPTLTRRENGELIVAFSGGREKHVCPFGRLEMMRSQDEGKTWGWPQVIYDSPIDDRDAGLLETAKGSLLITTFTSLAYQRYLEAAKKAKPGAKGAFANEQLVAEWIAADTRISKESQQSELGCFLLRSTDGGVTWSERIRIPCDSPHGPIKLKNGRLLYPGISLYGERQVGVWESLDDGLTWALLSPIPLRSTDQVSDYHELHAVECDSGKLVCHIRNHSQTNHRETLQSESFDGGKSWSEPRSIGVWGLPSHLLKLKNGMLVMSYGHRREPLGVEVRLSRDEGMNWSEAIRLNQDSTSWDLGYPSTVECSDGSLVTVWYEATESQPLAQLRQARWRIKATTNR